MAPKRTRLDRYLFLSFSSGMMMAMRGRTIIVAVVLLGSLLSAYAQDQEQPTPPPVSTRKAPAEPLLSRNVVVPIKTVAQFFPAVTRQLETGADADALGKPQMTRLVVYGTRDGAQKVTLSVNEFAYGSQALLAYQEAAQKTQLPAFETIAISNIGQEVFAGAMKQNGETQIVITAVIDSILVTAMLTGYEDTTDNIARLADLARVEVAEAHARVSARRRF